MNENYVGYFRGRKTIQRSATVGGARSVFVKLQGNKNELVYPTFGGYIKNPFKGAAKIFAGDLMEYRTDENGLKIEYRAISDKDTVCNLTNHSYFNLNGEKSGNILGHKLQMNSSFYTPNDRACMPTGEVLSVDNTPFDFRIRQTLGNGITSDFEQIRLFGGYDHNFILDGRGMRHAATLKGDKTGITMQMITDQPAVQIYTGNAIDEDVFNGDYQYHQYDAVCLETQVFPNSLKFAHFPDALLKAGEEYIHTVEYRFV